MTPGPAAATPIAFSADQLGEVRRLQSLYPDRRGALLPVLHMAQETFGHVSLAVEEYVGSLFELSPAHVHEELMTVPAVTIAMAPPAAANPQVRPRGSVMPGPSNGAA